MGDEMRIQTLREHGFRQRWIVLAYPGNKICLYIKLSESATEHQSGSLGAHKLALTNLTN